MSRKSSALSAFVALINCMEERGGRMSSLSLLEMTVEDLLNDVMGPNGITFTIAEITQKGRWVPFIPTVGVPLPGVYRGRRLSSPVWYPGAAQDAVDCCVDGYVYEAWQIDIDPSEGK